MLTYIIYTPILDNKPKPNKNQMKILRFVVNDSLEGAERGTVK
jgi:hypothetical protein